MSESDAERLAGLSLKLPPTKNWRVMLDSMFYEYISSWMVIKTLKTFSYRSNEILVGIRMGERFGLRRIGKGTPVAVPSHRDRSQTYVIL